MKILSLENYSESYPEEDAIASSESSHEPALEPYTPESEQAHLEKEQNHIEQALQTVVTLDGITTVMESMSDGLSPSAGKALMLAVEHLCSNYMEHHGKIKLPAFEEFSTKNHQRETALESMEVIKEYGAKIWDMIIKAFEAIIAFFKKIFNRQSKVNKDLIKEAETVQEHVREHAAKPVTEAPPKDRPTSYSSMAVFAALQINGKVPEGKVLVQETLNHFRLMKQFDYAFSLTESTVLKLLNTAIKAIHKEGPNFSDAINACQSEICTNNLGRLAKNQHAAGDLGQGFSLYEAPFIFGGKSVYRTGITGAATVTGESIRFFIADSYGAKNEYDIEPLPFLTGDVIDEITRLTKERVVSLKRVLDTRDQNCDTLEKIKRNLIQIRDNNSNSERVARRAKVMFHVVSIYFRYRDVMSCRLLNQDQKVCKALLSYVNVSVGKIQ